MWRHPKILSCRHYTISRVQSKGTGKSPRSMMVVVWWCNSSVDASQILASCTAVDFGLWSPENKSVHKYKVSSRLVSASWTPDGLYLALGQYDGQISMRDKQGQETMVINREHPVWCLAWSPVDDDSESVLAVGCWDQTLSFYNIDGTKVGKGKRATIRAHPCSHPHPHPYPDRRLDFDPCSIDFFTNEFIIVGGSNEQVQLWTKDGVFLTAIAELSNWVWTCRHRPNSFSIVGYGFLEMLMGLCDHEMVMNRMRMVNVL